MKFKDHSLLPSLIVATLFLFMSLLLLWTPTSTAAPNLFATATPTITLPPSSQRPQPDFPKLVDRLNFGLPSGNGYGPIKLTVDAQNRRLYTLNQGRIQHDQGNTISIFDLDEQAFIGLIQLNNKKDNDAGTPYPQFLGLDADRSRLYVITEAQNVHTLTLIDTTKFVILDRIPEVKAVAIGSNYLYLANDTALWRIDPDTLDIIDTHELTAEMRVSTLQLSPQANRLYLAYASAPSAIDIFDATALALITTYETSDEIVELIPDDAHQRLLVIERLAGSIHLHTLNANGRRLSRPQSLALSDTYGDFAHTVHNQSLYVADGNYDVYQLQILALPGQDAVKTTTLPAAPRDLAFDSQGNLVYLLYHDNAIGILDPETGDETIIHTAITLNTALADPTSNRLFVLTEMGMLHILHLDNYAPIAQFVLQNHEAKRFTQPFRRLALDEGRQRLYISGNPLHILDTQTLGLTVYPELNGQLTPDDTTDQLYFTQPCRCRFAQCNTFIFNAETLTGTQTLFAPQHPLSAPCVIDTHIDSSNQLLYATISNGVPGSNGGLYFTLFDLYVGPEPLFTANEISFGKPTFDAARQRLFVPQWRMNKSTIRRYDYRTSGITPTQTLVGAGGDLLYNPERDRVHAVRATNLRTFDSDLALLSEVPLPAQSALLAFNEAEELLYLKDTNGHLLIFATQGGLLQPPAYKPNPSATATRPHYITDALSSDEFRVIQGQLQRRNNPHAANADANWQSIGRGLPPYPITTLTISPNYVQDKTLFAALGAGDNRAGLYRSTDGGNTWYPATRGLTDLGITAILISPNFAADQTLFASTISQGLFRSSDGGENWVSLADRYAALNDERTVQHIALAPNVKQGEALLIIDTGSLLRSTDSGDTWQDLHIPGGGPVAFSPTFADDGLVLSNGRWRSTNGGQSWDSSAAGLAQNLAYILDLKFSPNFATDQTIYLLGLTSNLSTMPILQRSIDAGRSWQTSLNPQVDLTGTQIVPLASQDLILITSKGERQTLSEDQLKWGIQTVDLDGLELQALTVDRDGAIYLAGGAVGVFKSSDDGLTWVDTNFPVRGTRIDKAVLAVTDNNTVFAGLGPVITRSDDGGQSWQSRGITLPNFEVNAFAVSPNFAQDALILAGGNFSRPDLIRSVDGGKSWEIVLDSQTLETPSDIVAVAFSPQFESDGIVVAWMQYNGLLVSEDRGQTWAFVTEAQYKDNFVQSLTFAPQGGGLYLGLLSGQILFSDDGGQSWWLDLSVNNPIATGNVRAVVFDTAGNLFIGTDSGVYFSPDGGRSWHLRSDGLPTYQDNSSALETIQALFIHQDQHYALPREGGIFVSVDDGLSWRNTQIPKAITPTPTAIPITLPTPTVIPSPSPTPLACTSQPYHFGSYWADRISQLGCPISSRAVVNLVMAEQRFERGLMLWRSDTAEIIILPDDNPHRRHPDTWNDTQPEYSCPDLAPTQTPPTPKRGFGRVWCQYPEVRNQLGNAISAERIIQVSLQEFTAGWIFGGAGEAVYILEDRTGAWMISP